ncbi:MAG: DUF3078 domain-containing protein, partial [Bacteroidales bacterium]|nr:DUF3078 domain-containing protein [Bacteroidales bacterium]
KSKWENILVLAYGQSKVGKQDFRKNEDKIDFVSTYGLKAAEKWYYTANFDFKSQFAPGYDYHDDDPDLGKEKISNFLAPAFTSLGLGMEYRPYEFLSFYLSPATVRWIIVNDQELADKGAFGVDPAEYDSLGVPVQKPEYKVKDGATSKFEFGAKFRMMFVKDIVKNVSLSTKLELFSNYLEDPQNIDVNWDTMINMKINEWLSASFGLQMLYDNNTVSETQIKEYLSVGLMYKFTN